MTEVTIRGRALRQAEAVSLRRFDGAIFHLTAPCVLRLPDGLIHVVGGPNEELQDMSIWDITQQFDVLSIRDAAAARGGATSSMSDFVQVKAPSG